MELILIVVAAVSIGTATPSSNPPSVSIMQRNFPDALSCEQAASLVAAGLGTKLVCVPSESDTAQHIAC